MNEKEIRRALNSQANRIQSSDLREPALRSHPNDRFRRPWTRRPVGLLVAAAAVVAIATSAAVFINRGPTTTLTVSQPQVDPEPQTAAPATTRALRSTSETQRSASATTSGTFVFGTEQAGASADCSSYASSLDELAGQIDAFAVGKVTSERINEPMYDDPDRTTGLMDRDLTIAVETTLSGTVDETLSIRTWGWSLKTGVWQPLRPDNRAFPHVGDTLYMPLERMKQDGKLYFACTGPLIADGDSFVDTQSLDAVNREAYKLGVAGLREFFRTR